MCPADEAEILDSIRHRPDAVRALYARDKGDAARRLIRDPGCVPGELAGRGVCGADVMPKVGGAATLGVLEERSDPVPIDAVAVDIVGLVQRQDIDPPGLLQAMDRDPDRRRVPRL